MATYTLVICLASHFCQREKRSTLYHTCIELNGLEKLCFIYGHAYYNIIRQLVKFTKRNPNLGSVHSNTNCVDYKDVELLPFLSVDWVIYFYLF